MLPQHGCPLQAQNMYNMGPNVCLQNHPSFFRTQKIKNDGLGQAQTREKKKQKKKSYDFGGKCITLEVS
jgi:hypothetical protein